MASIPASVIQIVGDRSVVYVAQGGGRFAEREVQLGDAVGDQRQVRSGLAPGDRVVVEGSFFLRAEADRTGLRPRIRTSSGPSLTPSGATASASAPAQTFSVKVTEKGFEPSSLSVRAGIPARLTFTRVTDQTCATEIVFPDRNLRRALPLNEAVHVELTPVAGALTFVCGTNMFRGTVAVR